MAKDDAKGSEGAAPVVSADELAALKAENATLTAANAELTAKVNACAVTIDELNATILELRTDHPVAVAPPVPTGQGGIHTEHQGTRLGRVSRSAFGVEADKAREGASLVSDPDPSIDPD